MNYLIPCLAILFASTSVLAGGGNELGNGGDPFCFEYIETAKKIKKGSLKRGQDFLNKVNDNLNLPKIVSTVETLECIPNDSNNLDRIARTKINANKVVTTLNIHKWKKLDGHQKLKLTSHEVLVGSGIESEGQYAVSTDLYKLINTLPIFLKINSEKIEYLPSGSAVIFKPFIKLNDEKYFLSMISDQPRTLKYSFEDFDNRFCQFLGFEETINQSLSMSSTTSLIFISKSGEITNIDNNQHIASKLDFRETLPAYINRIICK